MPCSAAAAVSATGSGAAGTGNVWDGAAVPTDWKNRSSPPPGALPWAPVELITSGAPCR